MSSTILMRCCEVIKMTRLIGPSLSQSPRRWMYNRTTENTTLHPKAIKLEAKDEIEEYEEWVKDLGDSRFVKDPPNIPKRNYETSDAEWNYVKRLVDIPEIIPSLPQSTLEKDVCPSGFVAPKTKFGELPYFVRRTKNHLLPVYFKTDTRLQKYETSIRYVDGDPFALKKDLDQFLFERYNREFISQVAELYARIKYRGDFEVDFKEFLISKGF